jgi:serine/threonine protein kinase
VLELMGTSLDARLNEKPALTFEQKTWIALSVCRGLAHLHSRKPAMIHRDIK